MPCGATLGQCPSTLPVSRLTVVTRRGRHGGKANPFRLLAVRPIILTLTVALPRPSCLVYRSIFVR